MAKSKTVSLTGVKIKDFTIEVTQGDAVITMQYDSKADRMFLLNDSLQTDFVFDVPLTKVNDARVKKWTDVAKGIMRAAEIANRIKNGEVELPIKINE